MPIENKAIVIVAPNGARKSNKDHAQLPVNAAQVAADALLNQAAGATMIHAHARDESGGHSLDIEHNRHLYAALKEAVGDDLVIQLTTEAVGIYEPQQQMALIKEIQPEAASFALKELISSDAQLDRARDFFHWVATQGIIAQYIVYSAEEVVRYHQLKQQGVLPANKHHLLFVLGRYTDGQQSQPSELLPFIIEHKDDTPWAVCAFGRDEHQCVSAALSLGGDVRVGFENNLYNLHGQLAYNNAVLVKQAVDSATDMGREVMSAQEFRAFFA
ncbi:MAG: hypothetical protein OFPI_20640 [Osedax symbiont Rs2]|nr:MAG: hypothetical protein OFPI_20640 [Osedax symbiont Rs2]